MFLRFSTSANDHICLRVSERQQNPLCVLSPSFSKETETLIRPLCSSNKCWKLHFSGAGPTTAYTGLLSQQEPAVAEFHMDDYGLWGPTLKYEILCSFPLILHALYISAFGDLRCEAVPSEPWTVTCSQHCNWPAVRYNSHTHTFMHVSICSYLCSLHSPHRCPLTPEHHSTQWHRWDIENSMTELHELYKSKYKLNT